MNLSQAQQDLLERLQVDPEKGLSSDEASKRREEDGNFNTVDPPINCPPWICCLLPCIKHVPSMKAFRRIQPDDAEVLREGRWVRYDATSLVRGDILRLEEGDIVPADCVVLALDGSTTEMLVEHRCVTGEEKPREAKASQGGKTTPTQLFWGGQVVQGSAIAVATAVGQKTMVACMIRDGRFPPNGNVLLDSAEATTGPLSDDPDEEVGISLIARDTL